MRNSSVKAQPQDNGKGERERTPKTANLDVWRLEVNGLQSFTQPRNLPLGASTQRSYSVALAPTFAENVPSIFFHSPPKFDQCSFQLVHMWAGDTRRMIRLLNTQDPI